MTRSFPINHRIKLTPDQFDQFCELYPNERWMSGNPFRSSLDEYAQGRSSIEIVKLSDGTRPGGFVVMTFNQDKHPEVTMPVRLDASNLEEGLKASFVEVWRSMKSDIESKIEESQSVDTSAIEKQLSELRDEIRRLSRLDDKQPGPEQKRGVLRRAFSYFVFEPFMKLLKLPLKMFQWAGVGVLGYYLVLAINWLYRNISIDFN